MGKTKELSTVVDKQKKTRAPRVPAAETRERILVAAKVAFSQSGFDQVGVREIGKSAGVDPAVVIRLFGSKEALFTEIASKAFSFEPPFDGPTEGLTKVLADYVSGHSEHKKKSPDDGLDKFHMLLRSASSPIAGPILSKALHAAFIEPFAARLGEPEANTRAAMLAACLLGFATLHVVLASPDLKDDETGLISKRLDAVFQACLATN
ncbi:TetR/AcrR family transcriptional regulator [bacterium]|nr:MAG: TetR/AcrR family transcriptional regulator [bacterium]